MKFRFNVSFQTYEPNQDDHAWLDDLLDGRDKTILRLQEYLRLDANKIADQAAEIQRLKVAAGEVPPD